MHNPITVLEIETHEILWDFKIQTDHLISARRPDLEIVIKKKKKKKKRKEMKHRQILIYREKNNFFICLYNLDRLKIR